MKKNLMGFLLIIMVIMSCSVTPPPATENNVKTLEQAIREAAEEIGARFDAGTKIALLNFTSPSDLFGAYVLEELTANLVSLRHLAIIDRAEIELRHRELNFQMSGVVSDESMQSIGRTLGAQSIVSGSLTIIGDIHRIIIRVLNVESGEVEVQYRTNIAVDSMVRALLESSETEEPDDDEEAEPPLPDEEAEIPRYARTISETFIAGIHSFSLPSYVRFPATIEIYALGAGGGGQGGNQTTYMSGLGTRNEYTTGAAGGGGAAAYISFTIDQQEYFTIDVGRGGTGGAAVQRGLGQGWQAGNRGGEGGSTTVSWQGNSLSVSGGRGAGMNRSSNDRDLSGGSGGTAAGAGLLSAVFAENLDSRPGANGENGAHNALGTSRGGSAARITRGSIASFGGGAGGSASPASPADYGGGGAGSRGLNSGSVGGDGQVIITVSWFEFF